MMRQKPSNLIPSDGWIAFRDASAIIEFVYDIPEACSAPMLRRAVEMFSLSHEGIDYLNGGKIVSVQGNRDRVIPHKVSGWDAKRKQWEFLPASTDQFRPPKGLERQAGDDEIRSWDWELAEVDWQAGTVQGPTGRRLNILLHWRNVVGWVEGMKDRGYLVPVVLSHELRPTTVERRRPRATYAALAAWFKARVDGWPAGRSLPNEADDWQDVRANFKAGIDRGEFRAARRDNTPPSWKAKGPRTQPAKVWPFNRAD